MRESLSSPNLGPSQRSSSIRLRKRRDEGKQQFVKNRRSGEFGYRLSTNSDAVDNTDNTDDVLTNYKVDTLDPRPAAGGIQHNLRPLLRSKYIQSPISGTEESLGSVWGTGGRGGGGGGGVRGEEGDQYDRR